LGLGGHVAEKTELAPIGPHPVGGDPVEPPTVVIVHLEHVSGEVANATPIVQGRKTWSEGID
jgi:hypothetical protein